MVQKPFPRVHTDYTVHSAPRRLIDLTLPPTSNDTWGKYLKEGTSLIPKEILEDGVRL